MYIAPGRGQNFDVKRKALSLYPFVVSFKEISLKSDFIQFCSWFNTCIQPRGLKIGAQGQITPKWIIRSDPNSNLFELLCLSSFFFTAEGQATPNWLVRYDQNSNLSKILCLSSFPVSLVKSEFLATEKRWKHHFPHLRSMGTLKGV